MTAADVQQLVLDRVGLRIGPAMADYVLRRLQSTTPDAERVLHLPVIARDAPTGRPIYQLIDLETFSTDASVPPVSTLTPEP